MMESSVSVRDDKDEKAAAASPFTNGNDTRRNDLKMVGFDFDLTLSSRRVYGRTHFDRLPDLFGGETRIRQLKSFFTFLQHFNVRIVVVSWNYESIIVEALDRLGLIVSVHSIFDRRRMRSHGGYQTGKRNIVNKLCKEWHVRNDNVVFVDDSYEILSQMTTTTCQTVWVEGEAGMTVRDMHSVAASLGLNFDPGL